MLELGRFCENKEDCVRVRKIMWELGRMTKTDGVNWKNNINWIATGREPKIINNNGGFLESVQTIKETLYTPFLGGNLTDNYFVIPLLL